MKMHQNRINPRCTNALNTVFKPTFRDQKASNCEHVQDYYSRLTSDNIYVRMLNVFLKV